MTPKNLKFGCLQAPVDTRDHLFKSGEAAEINNIDLRPLCPPIRNQANLGACTAFGATNLVDFVRRKQGLPIWQPSPLFTYYSTRLMEGTVYSDSGAYVRDALKSTVNDGVAQEREWPYIVAKFDVRPDTGIWENATKHQTLEYLKIDDTSKNAVLSCLNEGYPFIFGLRLYSSFTGSIDTVFGGNVHEPSRDKEKILGGHCMMCVGYQKRDDGGEYAIVMNSWGPNWGDRGYCYIPLSYLLSNDSYDFWTIRSMEVCTEDTADPLPVPAPVIPPEPEPEPTPEPVPTPTPVTPEPVPVPTPVPTPTPDPLPLPVPVPEDNSFSKMGLVAIIVFILLAFLFTIL